MKRPAIYPWWAASALVALVCLTLEVPARAQSPASTHKFDEVVRGAVAEGRSVSAIVRFRSEAARARGAAIVATRGGSIRAAHNDVTALTVDVDASTASVLATDLGILTISVDAPVRSAGVAMPVISARASGASRARAQFERTGHGLTVAVIDSGVHPHDDLPAHRIRKFVDFVNGRETPYDDFGHGTHVAGILAGNGARSSSLDDPYIGIAPGADVVALKVLDAEGVGKTSDVIAALEWVAQHHLEYNIRVVNLSLGHPVYEPAATDPLVQAAEALVARGIVVVASAGNLGIDPTDNLPGNGGVTSPANGSRIIAVGAVDDKGTYARSDDVVADYSSRGPTRFDLIVKPDIVAAGHRVPSLMAPVSYLYRNYPKLHLPVGTERSASYMVLSGTSMAAPHVAGTAALMLEANPSLSVGAVRAVLEFTAQQVPNTSLLAQGAGQLNAYGAVRLARQIMPGVGNGQVWLRSAEIVPRDFDSLYGETVTWGKNIVWADGVLLGDAAYVKLAAWDDNIVWGQDLDNIVWGQCGDDGCDNIVWGQCDSDGCDNIVWGQDRDNIVWGQSGDNIVWGDRFRNIVWGQCANASCDNIVWGQGGDNIVWGQCQGSGCDNIVWGQSDNIVWGQCAGAACDNIVWGQDNAALGYWADNTVWGFWDNSVNWTTVNRLDADNIVWGQDYLTNIVWGQCSSGNCDNIVWGQGLGVLTTGGR
jgi:serine protease AprX